MWAGLLVALLFVGANPESPANAPVMTEGEYLLWWQPGQDFENRPARTAWWSFKDGTVSILGEVEGRYIVVGNRVWLVRPWNPRRRADESHWPYPRTFIEIIDTTPGGRYLPVWAGGEVSKEIMRRESLEYLNNIDGLMDEEYFMQSSEIEVTGSIGPHLFVTGEFFSENERAVNYSADARIFDLAHNRVLEPREFIGKRALERLQHRLVKESEQEQEPELGGFEESMQVSAIRLHPGKRAPELTLDVKQGRSSGNISMATRTIPLPPALEPTAVLPADLLGAVRAKLPKEAAGWGLSPMTLDQNLAKQVRDLFAGKLSPAMPKPRPQPETWRLEGTLGEQTPVRMYLEREPPRWPGDDPNRLRGVYYYLKHSRPIYLRGRIDDAGAITLTEGFGKGSPTIMATLNTEGKLAGIWRKGRGPQHSLKLDPGQSIDAGEGRRVPIPGSGFSIVIPDKWMVNVERGSAVLIPPNPEDLIDKPPLAIRWGTDPTAMDEFFADYPATNRGEMKLLGPDRRRCRYRLPSQNQLGDIGGCSDAALVLKDKWIQISAVGEVESFPTKLFKSIRAAP